MLREAVQQYVMRQAGWCFLVCAMCHVERSYEVWLVGDGDMYIYIFIYIYIYKWGEPKRMGATWDNANKVHAT